MADVLIANMHSKGWPEPAVKVDRSSPLGNPFKIGPESDRARVCRQYEEWFNHRVRIGDEVVLNELRRLYRLAQEHGQVTLLCHCSPKQCHAETIRDFLKRYI